VPDQLTNRPAGGSPAALEVARTFLLELAALDAGAAEPAHRLRELAEMEPRIEAMLAALDAFHAGLPQPLEAPALAALNLSRQLSQAAAAIYERTARLLAVSNAADAASRTLPGRPRLGPLVFRAMAHTARAMRTSYKAYTRQPAGAWKTTHQLYLFAEEMGVAAGIADSHSRMTIAGLYGETLLLALADPYRLEPGEVERVEALLRALRPALSLAREAPETPASRHFMVNLREDAPPAPVREDSATPNDGDVRVFDTSGVVDAARGSAGAEAQAFVAKLLTLWDGPPRRAFRREAADGSVAICVGVKPIAHFVAHDAAADGEAETKALREGLTMPLRTLPEDEGGRMIPIHEWAVINLSAGGLRLRRRAATTHPLVVGEVVGIRAPGKALWTVGVTRWVTADEDGTTEFGVQFFAEAACAVWIRGLEKSSTRKLGLLVSELGASEAESLLAPPGTCASGGPFDVRGEEFRARMRLAEVVEANSRFELVRVKSD
jgi:cyclic-di-GMP-binding protein